MQYDNFLDIKEWNIIKSKLGTNFTPSEEHIFEAFKLCNYNSLKIIMLGQDPYHQRGVATGLAFANHLNTKKLSPSLEILREAVLNPTVPKSEIPIFDITLESWAKQGILLLNSALTVELNRPGSHVMLWRKFISTFLHKLSNNNPGLLYILLGRQAQSFKSYINPKLNSILIEQHPAYYARINQRMPSTLFENIDKIMINQYGEKIQWYKTI